MKSLGTLAVAALVTVTASAGDHRQPKAPVYPKAESIYIKRFTVPTINCGACFGYYTTQWRSWADACGQPDVVYVAAPTPGAAPSDAKLPDVKPVDPTVKPKTPEVAPLPVPKTPDPVPLPDPKPIEPKKPGESGKSSMLPVPAITVSIAIPIPEAAPAAPVIPLIPTMPAVNVK